MTEQRSRFNFRRDVKKKRWISYFHQIDEILSFHPANILEIGVGFSLNGHICKHEGVGYKGMDIRADVNPDIVGSITDIPLPDKSIDVVCAFQIIEHMPYENFTKALSEMCRVAKKGVIVSLPRKDNGDVEFEKTAHHFWEIGFKGYELDKITDIITQTADLYFFSLIKSFRVPEYHHFFVLSERCDDKNISIEKEKKISQKEMLFKKSIDTLYHYLYVAKEKNIETKETLTRESLSLLSTDKAIVSHKYTALDIYARLKDEESRTIYKEMFYHHFLGNSKALKSWRHYRNIFMTTLQNRLVEKGKDLTGYMRYDRDFFVGTQYFDLPAIQPRADEVFVDAGAYTGDTIQGFLKFSQNRYKHIYAFEPDPHNYQKLCENVKQCGIENTTLIPKGAYSENTVLKFSTSGSGLESKLTDNGDIKIPVTSIDSCINIDENITFIKIDIEGSELEALIGAKDTIKRCKPRLAICIYHKPPEDIIDIPAYLLNLVPEYKFYIRHYTIRLSETVLYAMV